MYVESYICTFLNTISDTGIKKLILTYMASNKLKLNAILQTQKEILERIEALEGKCVTSDLDSTNLNKTQELDVAHFFPVKTLEELDIVENQLLMTDFRNSVVSITIFSVNFNK